MIFNRTPRPRPAAMGKCPPPLCPARRPAVGAIHESPALASPSGGGGSRRLTQGG